MHSDPAILVAELNGTRCACGGLKRKRQSFCRDCYYTLTPAQRNELYRGVGEGYEEAYDYAVVVLKREGRIA